MQGLSTYAKGIVIAERERLLGPTYRTVDPDPDDVLQGVEPREACAYLRWLVSKPDGVLTYDLQLWRYSLALEKWVTEGERVTGLTSSHTVEQQAGAPLYLQLLGFATISAGDPGFRKAVQGFNKGTG